MALAFLAAISARLTAMTGAHFLHIDESYRTVCIPWSSGFNTRLAQIAQDTGPDVAPATKYPDLAEYRAINDNALRLLDSRMVTSAGKLPTHLCGMAWRSWDGGERRLTRLMEALVPPSKEELTLEDLCVFATLTVLRFNMANISVVDEEQDVASLMAPGEISRLRHSLSIWDAAESRVERELDGLPAPTRQVRQAIDYALGS